MLHPDFFWACRFLKVKLSGTEKLTMVAGECSKIFDVESMGYLCLLKRYFVFNYSWTIFI